MKYKYIISQTVEGCLWVKIAGPEKDKELQVSTVKEACRVLKKTRRQIYRYMSAGMLPSVGKFLGEWLLDFKALENLSQYPLTVQPLPVMLKPLFPEYDISRLNRGRDRVIVLSRILEMGSFKQLNWLFRRYSKKTIAHIIKTQGRRLLSKQSLKLWSLYFNVKPALPPLWRTQSQLW